MTRTPSRLRQWLGCGGCVVLVAGLFALLVSIAGAMGPLLFAAVVAMLAVVAWWYLSARRRAITAFRVAHRDSGKDVVIVYTDSPHWKDYIETHWLPRWGHRAVALDRSRPWSFDQPEARLWQVVAGSVEHTPVVIVVPRQGRVHVVRFYLAFRDFKHGKDRKLREAEARLAKLLDEPSS
ncbi:MAG TPA: hypothetical protein VKA54_13725 [Gemmatimonadaceae bacterium]|nr:hypothetical protein [Gemmatimonadaceae bacterium]